MASTNTEARRSGGYATPPKVGAINWREVLADFDARKSEYVPLSELGARIGFDRQARAHAIREGLITTAPPRAAKNSYTVTRDEAASLILAAVLALAAGVALVIMLRGVKGAGLTGAAAVATLRNIPT